MAICVEKLELKPKNIAILLYRQLVDEPGMQQAEKGANKRGATIARAYNRTARLARSSALRSRRCRHRRDLALRPRSGEFDYCGHRATRTNRSRRRPVFAPLDRTCRAPTTANGARVVGRRRVARSPCIN